MSTLLHRVDMFTILRKLGLTTNLKLCLDPGSKDSLPAASTKALDLSGGGYDFFRGATVASEASDPTINGTAGGLSIGEYLSFDAGDYLTYDTTNEAWMNNLHKDNAKFSMMALIYPGSTADCDLWGNNDDAVASIGSLWQARPSDGFVITNITRGSGGTLVANCNGNVGVAATVWNCVGVSIDEPNNIGFVFRNGIFADDSSVTYSTPSAAAASFTTKIGQAGNGSFLFPNGTRLGPFCVWEGSIVEKGQMAAVFQAIRSRYQI